MKKTCILLLVLTMLLPLAACGGAAAEPRQSAASKNSAGSVSQLLEDAAAEAPADAGTASGATQPEETSPAATPKQAGESSAVRNGEIDVDLTQLSSLLVYTEVFNMVTKPEEYLGKTIRLAGYGASLYSEQTDTTYYAVIVPDAAACCAQGIEYLLAGDAAYPADDTDITVTGAFEMYEELGAVYCRLGNATIEVDTEAESPA